MLAQVWVREDDEDDWCTGCTGLTLSYKNDLKRDAVESSGEL